MFEALQITTPLNWTLETSFASKTWLRVQIRM